MDSDEDKNEEQVHKKHQQLLYKINYIDDPDSMHPRKYKYSPETLLPFLYFYKLLALRPCERKHRNTLVLNIPDTVIFNDGDNPMMWMYTNDRGEVARMDNVPYFQIINKFTEGALEKQLVAVLKKPSYGYGGPSGNDCKVVSASQIKNVLSLVLAQRNDVSVIQKFVKSSSVKPSMVRTCWRASGNNQSWTINSNYEYTSKAKVHQLSKFIVNTKNSKAFRAVKNVSEKFTNETLKYVRNIVDFISRNLKVKFKQFVCDFVKDEGGNWWFINVKAFILESDDKIDIKPITMHDDEVNEEEKGKKNLQTYTKCRKCSYCNKVVVEHLMTHKLTLMMILQCDQHLVRLGKNFPWLQRCYKQHVNSVNLYVEHKVCNSCYKLYTEIQKLVEYETKLAKAIGIKVKNDNKNMVSITAVPTFKGHSPQFGSRFEKVKYDKEMPKDWGLPQDQQISIGLQNDSCKTVKKCRLMVFIHGIRDIPVQFLNSNKQYSIRYQIFDHSVTYKVNLQDAENFEEMLKISINKIKVIYFFCQQRDDISNFVKSEKSLKIYLLEGKTVMGSLDLQLDDFKSDKVIKKDYFKMFSGPNVFPYLSWGLFASVGIHEGTPIDSSTVKLLRNNSILLPEKGYHGPDLIPEQWLEMINDKPDVPICGLAENSSAFQQRTIKTQSQLSVSQKVKKQALDYSKRKIGSQHKHKRKAYY